MAQEHDIITQEFLSQARSEVQELSAHEAYKLYKNVKNVTFVDIREPEHVALGYIKGSVSIRADELEMQVRHLLPDKDAPLLLYCNKGSRSLMTAFTLKEMGYHHVSTLAGGIEAWKASGYEIVTDGLLTLEQLTRYSRQIIISGVGIEGQKSLLDAKVLLVGAGGLGSSAGLYLASAGIGTIGIMDFDRVDKSNLNRQVIHRYADIGRPKVESAKETVHRLNPETKVVTMKGKLTPENALEIVSDFDIVVDGADNFPTKYLINDACYFAGIPYIFGAAVQFEGQASVFHPKAGGPCLRCMWPVPPESELVPTWSEIGVLGVVPGQIGLIQATEVIKILLGMGIPLIGRFLLYDALNSDYTILSVKRNDSCPLCSEQSIITDLSPRHYLDPSLACNI